MTPRSPETTILIADDHRIIITAFKLMFSRRDGYAVVGEALTPDEVLPAYKQLRPDVVLLDISFRGFKRTGLDVIKELIDYDPEARIVVLSQHDQELVIKDAYRLGAKAYVLKNEDSDGVVCPAVDAAAIGEEYYSPEVSAKLARLQITGGSLEQLLTPEELEYFKLFAMLEKPEDVAAQKNASPRTVRAIRARIKQKLGVVTDYELVRKAIDIGIIDSRPTL